MQTSNNNPSCFPVQLSYCLHFHHDFNTVEALSSLLARDFSVGLDRGCVTATLNGPVQA